MWWILLAAVLVALVAYIWTLAVRIDRLHRRVATARGGLELALVKRAACSMQLATSGLLPRRDAEALTEAANGSLAAIEDTWRPPRFLAESALSRALRQVCTPEQSELICSTDLGRALWNELAEARYRLQISRTLYNQDVSLVQELRARRLVRFLHLAGFAPLPSYVDLDDAS